MGYLPWLCAIAGASVTSLGGSVMPRQPEAAAGGESLMEVLDDAGRLNYFPECIVAVVDGILDPSATTNSNPPRLKLRILEGLKGSLDPEDRDTIDAVWEPVPYDAHGAGSGPGPGVVEKWKGEHNPPPPLGSRWIMSGEVKDGILLQTPYSRYPYTKEKRAWALREILTGGTANLAHEAAHEADLRVQDAANLRELFDASEFVLVVEDARSLSHDLKYMYVRVLECVKGDPQKAPQAGRLVFLDPRPDSRVLFEGRLGTAVAFVRLRPGLAYLDPRFPSLESKTLVFQPVDPLNGILEQNDKRKLELDALRPAQK